MRPIACLRRSEADPAVVGGVCLAPVEVAWLAALARVVRQSVESDDGLECLGELVDVSCLRQFCSQDTVRFVVMPSNLALAASNTTRIVSERLHCLAQAAMQRQDRVVQAL
ncbi:hypothetical protein H257_13159 [Aphanomyces astaci]|uniref:Uncharacterized protein n=1 Tax=Aphanomyces astaci TaxID=112090 RepID=W4FW77_APHAT|nr:hypothetical protein H257_13159 [Aphanomyces astaci]ETV71732.1 hypothetical protein H257_13159 [Aphanomyces astaci]|eukprot:XP_009838920.1 hypothetical protein H257_13159 [Aphanomyces astaci]